MKCFAVAVMGLVSSSLHAMSYGTTSHLAWGEYSAREKSFQMARAAGIEIIRCDFNWPSIVKPDGRVLFERTDRIVADAARHGLKILPIIDYEHPQLCPKPHRDPDAWAKYVRMLAERYGDLVPAFEVWNEPDHKKSFCGEIPNPTNYFVLLERASRELRVAAPKAKIVLGGMAGVDLAYIEELYRLGAKDLFDIMNVHPYTHPLNPEKRLDVDLTKLRKLMAKHGDADKPVWITEIGWPTHEVKFINADVFKRALSIAKPERRNWRAVFLTTDDPPDDRYLKAMADQLLTHESVVEHLSPENAPSRLARDDVDLVIFPLNESYSVEAFPYVVEFVRRGGVLADFGGHPMYYPVGLRKGPDGSSDARKESELARRALRIETTSVWKDPKCPRSAVTYLVAAGSEGNARKGISSVHFLTDGLLSPGDEFVPVCETTTNGLHLVSAGVYKLNSDMKGAVVVGTMRLEGTWPTSGERRQAVMTVRAAGLSLASGIDMFMPYELRAIERDRYDTESHFGLLHNNFSPKPVYVAMMTFITMCPPRSTAVKGKWSERGCIYFSQWRRPSDAKYWMENGDLPAEAGMIWCIGKPEKRLIIFSRSQMRFFDSFGCEIFPVVVDDAYELVLSGEPVYYCGGFVEEVDLQ